MNHPLTDGTAPGEWRDDKQERRLASLAERRLAEAVARIAVLEAALSRALNYLENTESELGMTLPCADEARAALTKCNS